MGIDYGYSAAVILVVAGVTALTRAAPFLLFGGKKALPPAAAYLGRALPPAIMVTLVVYCLRHIDLVAVPSGIAELVSVGVVIALHRWKGNTLLSIFLGTACYMLLSRIL